MGGAASVWYKNQRKMLVLAFDDCYLNKINKVFLNKELKLEKQVGFVNQEYAYKNLDLKLWYLSSYRRHHWRHHYYGTQGVVMIFSINDKKNAENIIMEALTVISDSYLCDIPILILLDKENSDLEEYTELFRNKLSKLKNNLLNTQYIYFDKYIGDIYYGLDWLCDVMKPI